MSSILVLWRKERGIRKVAGTGTSWRSILAKRRETRRRKGGGGRREVWENGEEETRGKEGDVEEASRGTPDGIGAVWNIGKCRNVREIEAAGQRKEPARRRQSASRPLFMTRTWILGTAVIPACSCHGVAEEKERSRGFRNARSDYNGEHNRDTNHRQWMRSLKLLVDTGSPWREILNVKKCWNYCDY